MGYDSYMVYNDRDTGDDCVYAEKYTYLKRANHIEDSHRNLLFIPESFHIPEVLQKYNVQQIQLVVSWLSLDYGIARLNTHFEYPHMIHVFQSEYARTRVVEEARQRNLHIKCFDIYDYTHDDYVQYLYMNEEMPVKMNCVAYNPKKDTITQRICQMHMIPTIPLENMSQQQVIETLKKCKVYVDCGNHPGRDRIPREAAAVGCIVITNTQGSAGVWNDVPIHQKVSTHAELVQTIKHAFENYKLDYDSQKEFREGIKNEKKQLEQQFRTLLESL
jgi:hypothetical protein